MNRARAETGPNIRLSKKLAVRTLARVPRGDNINPPTQNRPGTVAPDPPKNIVERSLASFLFEVGVGDQLATFKMFEAKP